MANLVYGGAREAFALKRIDWRADEVRPLLVHAARYDPDRDRHRVLADVPQVARIALGGPLNAKTVELGWCRAADAVLERTDGERVGLIVLVHWSDESERRLIAAIDTMAGLPFEPNGGDVILKWPREGIFQL